MLINGSPTSEFKVSKGLRQRDLLVPFLYVVVVEGLSGLMREAIELNMFSSF